MLQCPSCGRRFRESRCPTHGTPVSLSSLGTHPEPTPPHFPGYRVTRVLGQGGFGTVYAAEGPDGPCAIKTSHRNLAVADARLHREADALAAVGPPYVPRLHAQGSLADGTFYVVMDLIGWPTLAELLCDRPPWSASEVLPVARGVLRALVAAHAADRVHRDLKPENIFVGEGDVKLVDFGLVKVLGSADEQLTLAGSIIGSPAYMSPEQSAGKTDLDARSDIYSFGVILYELLAGRPPFLGPVADVTHAHLGRRPPRLASLVPVSPALDELVHACLAKSLSDRPASAAALLPRLEEACVAPIPAGEATLPPTLAAPLAGGAPGGATLSREKRAVVLGFFRSSAATAAVQGIVTAFGGTLARADGSYAAVFDHDAGENPAERALAAARGVLERGLAPAVLLDATPVTVVPRPDGGRRYVSPLFAKPESYPSSDGGTGVFVTSRLAGFGVTGTLEPAARGLYLARGSAEQARPAAPALVGRDAELAQVIALAVGADGRLPVVITVLGEAGTGKSHFLAAAADRLRAARPGAWVLEHTAREPSGLHGGALGELLRLVLGLPATRPDDGGRAALAERLGFVLAAEVWPGVATVMGWAAAGDADVRAVAAAPGALRAAAARAVSAGLRQAATDRLVAIFLDDAGVADPAGLDALELATLEETRGRIAVVVAARPTILDSRPRFGERAARQLRITLGALPKASADELMRHLLEPAVDVPDTVIAELVTRAQAVPLLMTELARGLKREGLVRKPSKGEGHYLAIDALEALPDLPLVEWLAARELAWMPPELARHARLLALLGPEVRLPQIAGVLAELDRAGHGAELPLDAEIATRRLLAGGLLIEREDGRLAFRSGVVRDAVVAAVPAAAATTIHEAAYRYYRGSADPDGLPALAHHAARCGLREEAFETALLLATRAEAAHAYLDAERFYGRALDQRAVAGERVVRVLRGRGLMRYRLARYDDALHDLREAGALAAAAGDRETEIGVALDEATIFDWLDDFHQTRALAERARELAAGLAGGPGALLEARLAMALGRSAHRFAEEADAARLLLEASRRAEPLGDAGYETYVVSLLLGGLVLALLGRLDESEEAFDRVVPYVAARGDKLHLGAALGNRFVLWAQRGRHEQMLADLTALLGITRELGNPRMECFAQLLLALGLHQVGRHAEAEIHARRGVELDDRSLGDAVRMESRTILARILAVSGRLADAAAVLDDIRAHQDRARARGSRDAELVPPEQVFVDMVGLLIAGGGDAEAWVALEARARQHLAGPDLDGFLAVRVGR